MKRRCVFLDRDGVINQSPPEGEYITSWDEFVFLPGIADWIRLLNALGFLLIVVTNQRGVALGSIDPGNLDIIHQNMIRELRSMGAHIDDVFCCGHEEGTCDCRKPLPGMVLQAQQKWNIDLKASLLIGDSRRDRLLAEACGMGFVLVKNGHVVDVERKVESHSL